MSVTILCSVTTGDVMRVPDEFEDIPLGDAYVLEKMPDRVACVRQSPVDFLQGETGNGVTKTHVSIPGIQETE